MRKLQPSVMQRWCSEDLLVMILFFFFPYYQTDPLVPWSKLPLSPANLTEGSVNNTLQTFQMLQRHVIVLCQTWRNEQDLLLPHALTWIFFFFFFLNPYAAEMLYLSEWGQCSLSCEMAHFSSAWQTKHSKEQRDYQEKTRHCAIDENADFTSPWL